MPATKKPQRRAPWHARKDVRLGALGAAALAAAVAIAVVLGNNGHDHSRPHVGTVTPIGPVVLSASELATWVGDLNQRVYWIGPVSGEKYELTRSATNSVFIRYVPPFVKAGTHEREYLVIATYPYKGALAAVKASGVGKPVPVVAGGRQGIAVVKRASPTNVLVAFRGLDFQIEVFDPSPKLARTVATSGDLTPVR